MYGPPGTGKTLLARACAAQTDATFLKLAGPQLVQMFIGDGAKLVRDCFALAKEKAPAIIFIDELDAVGTKRFDSEKSGDREVQRTMLELLNQLDGFASDDRIKVLAATNRVDVLDPALLRSGRLDRKIEFPLPNEEARAKILRIHSRKMKVDANVNWEELARSTDEFGGAMLKAVCVEAGMIALRMGKNQISHEHYVDAIAEVQAKKKDVRVPTPSPGLDLLTDMSTRPSTSTLDPSVRCVSREQTHRLLRSRALPWGLADLRDREADRRSIGVYHHLRRRLLRMDLHCCLTHSSLSPATPSAQARKVRSRSQENMGSWHILNIENTCSLPRVWMRQGRSLSQRPPDRSASGDVLFACLEPALHVVSAPHRWPEASSRTLRYAQTPKFLTMFQLDTRSRSPGLC